MRNLLGGLFRPKTLQEDVEAQKRKLQQKQAELSRGGNLQRPNPSSKAGTISLGPILEGDRFPDHLGVVTDAQRWLGLQEKVLNYHMLVVGSTGAGKSETLLRIIAEVLQHTDRDVFVVDGKGEAQFALDVANLMYQARREPVPIFRLEKTDYSSVYHGFCGGAKTIFNRLSALTGVEEAEGVASYYGDVNRDLLQLICYVPEGPPRSFEEVRQRLDPLWLKTAYTGDTEELRAIEGIKAQAFNDLLLRVRPLAREFSPVVDPAGFQLEKTRGAIFSIRTLGLGDTARRFVKFLIEDVSDFLGNRQQRPGLLIIDEFGLFGADKIAEVLKLSRSAQLGVILATQTIASLGKDKQVRDDILENTKTKIWMGVELPDEIVKLVGTREAIETSLQFDENSQAGSLTARMQEQFSIKPDEVVKLKPGEAWVVRQRYRAKIQVERVGVKEHDPQAVTVIDKPERTEVEPTRKKAKLKL